MEILKLLSEPLTVILFVGVIFLAIRTGRGWIGQINKNFAEVKTGLELVIIEIKCSDYASDHFLSNGESFLEIKNEHKIELMQELKDKKNILSENKKEAVITP